MLLKRAAATNEQLPNLSVWSSWKKTAIAVWRSCTHNRCLQRPAARSLRRNSLHLGYASGRACDSHLGGTDESNNLLQARGVNDFTNP